MNSAHTALVSTRSQGLESDHSEESWRRPPAYDSNNKVQWLQNLILFLMQQSVFRVGTGSETLATHGNSQEIWNRKRDKFNAIVFIALGASAARVLPSELTVLSEPTEVWNALNAFVGAQSSSAQETCRLIILLFNIKYAFNGTRHMPAHGAELLNVRRRLARLDTPFVMPDSVFCAAILNSVSSADEHSAFAPVSTTVMAALARSDRAEVTPEFILTLLEDRETSALAEHSANGVEFTPNPGAAATALFSRAGAARRHQPRGGRDPCHHCGSGTHDLVQCDVLFGLMLRARGLMQRGSTRRAENAMLATGARPPTPGPARPSALPAPPSRECAEFFEENQVPRNRFFEFPYSSEDDS